MSVLNDLASAQGRRDEVPNQQLARKLARDADSERAQEDIQVLVSSLKNKNKAIRHDCIKVLYEIGAEKPQLIEQYVDEFVALLTQRDNRMVWGGMTALGSIAALKPRDLWKYRETLIQATQGGSAITQDWGIRVLAALCAASETYASNLFPFLMNFLENCPAKDVPRHAESILLGATNRPHQDQLRKTLEGRRSQLTTSQGKRVDKLIQRLAVSNAD